LKFRFLPNNRNSLLYSGREFLYAVKLNFPGWQTAIPAEIHLISRAELLQQQGKGDEVIGFVIGTDQQLGVAPVQGISYTTKRFRFGTLYIHFHIGKILVETVHWDGRYAVQMGVLSR
jgi:hypothetical protein